MSSLEKKMFFFPMLFLFFFIFPSSIMTVYCHANGDYCKPVNCSRNGPEIRFPFRLKDGQPQRCGYPGFDLFCNHNRTMIYFPPLRRDLVVRQINYKSQSLIADDPNNCLERLLFGTSYSYDPVSYQIPADSNIFSSYNSYTYGNYTLVNCSRNAVLDYPTPTACLSDAHQNAFLIPGYRSVDSLVASCQPIKTISVPGVYPLDLNLTRAYELENKKDMENLLSYFYWPLSDEGVLVLRCADTRTATAMTPSVYDQVYKESIS